MIVFLGLSEKWECALKENNLNKEKDDQPLEVGVRTHMFSVNPLFW